MEEKINFTQMFKNSRLFKKQQQSKWFLFAVMRRFFKLQVLWEWTDIALCFKVYQQTDFSDYHIGIDIQILWFNLWLQCFRKTYT